MSTTIRVAAIQTKQRTIPYRVADTAEALCRADANIEELVALAERAGDMGCDIVAFPEDTLGTLEWEAGHWDDAEDLLAPAEERMLAQLGRAAKAHSMHCIVCNDCAHKGKVYNTAILIGRNGEEIGRYRKVQLPLHEQSRARGKGFPVFEADGVGTVGMCICYDMVFPETTRALALAGADIVFHSTLGGAAMASEEVSLAAFRTRAVDNFVYVVVAFRGGGSLIIGPKGEILADGGREPDAIVTADIDPAGGREAGDSLGGMTEDFRARLFRERVPSAYGILMEQHPPALDKLKDVHVPRAEEVAALCAEGMTTGADEFYEAEALLREGKRDEAKRRFEYLSEHFGTLWIGRVARERLAEIKGNG